MKNVTNLAKVSNDARHWSALDAIKDHQEHIDTGGALEDFDKILIISLNDNNGEFTVKWTQSGLKSSVMLAVLETAKSTILESMGY